MKCNENVKLTRKRLSNILLMSESVEDGDITDNL